MAERAVQDRAGVDHGPLLNWLIFTGVSAFGFVMVWHFGLFRLMLASDRTHLSLVITLLYVMTTLHCCYRTWVVSRETEKARGIRDLVERDSARLILAGTRVTAYGGRSLPEGPVTDHIRNLIIKATRQGGGRVDQSLLLRGLADALRQPNRIGSFASDTLMKLGLLGTIIGFIIMLAPIAGLDSTDKTAIRNSMGLMSDGMAVAMYTTLTGLIGSILIKIQYSLLENATGRLFGLATDLTEVYVLPVLEREPDGQLR